MTRRLSVALVAVALLSAPALGSEKRTKSEKKKTETGASCKAPAVGTCAACSISCRPGETAICQGGLTAGDMCHTQPSCKCSR